MKRARRRENPKHRSVDAVPADTDLDDLSNRVRYVGSPYHKDVPSFAGPLPQPRPDASICPSTLAQDREAVESLLKRGIRNGWCKWEEGLAFPQYVWLREGETVYEARLTNRESGEYKGYPLTSEQVVKGLP